MSAFASLLLLTKSLLVEHKRTMHTDYTLRYLLYSTLCVTADILDAIILMFHPEKKPKVSYKPSDIDNLSDKEIKDMMLDIPFLFADDHTRIFRLSSGTIAKMSDASFDDGNVQECDLIEDDENEDYDKEFLRSKDDDNSADEGPVNCAEANMANILFEKTNIPVPRIRRVIRWGDDYIIVMDYVQGRTLAEVWPTYSLWMKIRVAFILRRYVRQLSRVKAPIGTPPGPVSNEGPKKCYLPSIFGHFRSMRGPFESYKQLMAFFDYRRHLVRKGDDHPFLTESSDNSSPLVITHNHLDPRHIIVGEDGHLWIVDWAWSGYYPPWFEYVAMEDTVFIAGLRGWYDRFWKLAVPFICGPYFKQLEWIDEAGPGLDRL